MGFNEERRFVTWVYSTLSDHPVDFTTGLKQNNKHCLTETCAFVCWLAGSSSPVWGLRGVCTTHPWNRGLVFVGRTNERDSGSRQLLLSWCHTLQVKTISPPLCVQFKKTIRWIWGKLMLDCTAGFNSWIPLMCLRHEENPWGFVKQKY